MAEGKLLKETYPSGRKVEEGFETWPLPEVHLASREEQIAAEAEKAGMRMVSTLHFSRAAGAEQWRVDELVRAEEAAEETLVCWRAAAEAVATVR